MTSLRLAQRIPAAGVEFVTRRNHLIACIAGPISACAARPIQDGAANPSSTRLTAVTLAISGMT